VTARRTTRSVAITTEAGNSEVALEAIERYLATPT